MIFMNGWVCIVLTIFIAKNARSVVTVDTGRVKIRCESQPKRFFDFYYFFLLFFLMEGLLASYAPTHNLI
jgi:hypothetical protein